MKNRQGKEFISIEEFSLACTKASATHLAQMKEAEPSGFAGQQPVQPVLGETMRVFGPAYGFMLRNDLHAVGLGRK